MIFAKYAAPGMCNPADPEPCTSGTPTQAQIDNDHRSLAQRQHDALIAVGRIALMSGELGQLNGLPVSIIIRTTLQDLESRAGVGVTGGGTIMPITDVIRLAAHANHYLAVFDQATGSALDLFRAKRVASPAQRIMLIGREGGCTKPCCTRRRLRQPRSITWWPDWVDGGKTNVDELGLACGPDNRMVDRTAGGPPASTPAARSNGPHPHTWTPAKPGSTTTTDPNDSCTHPTTNPNPTRRGTPPPEPIGDGGCREPQPLDPVGDDDADQPGGPTDEPDTGELPTARTDRGWRLPRTGTVPPRGDDDADQPDEPEPTTTTLANPHRPNRSGIAAAANRNRSTPWGTIDADEPGGPAPPDDQAA